MRYSSDKYILVDSDMIGKAIKKGGIAQDKLSTMLLNKNSAYVSQSLQRGTFEIEALQKLCSFLGIDYESTIKKSEPTISCPEPTKKQDDLSAKMETLIVGVGTLYEEQKKTNDLIAQLLIEVKATNAKQNRLENALGQIVQNTIILKENTSKIVDTQNHLSSQANIVSGRTRDIVQAFQKVGNHNAK